MLWLAGAAFVVAAVAEYYSERWSIRHTQLANGKLPFDPGRMHQRVRRTQRLGVKLLLLGLVDTGSIFGGVGTFLAAHLGSQVGAWFAVEDEMWGKWVKRNRALGRMAERPGTWRGRLTHLLTVGKQPEGSILSTSVHNPVENHHV